MNGEGGNFREQHGRIETLVLALEELPDTAAREAARKLTRALFELHATGLQRILKLADEETVSQLIADPVVNGLLLLHAIHPQPPTVRISLALERIRHHFVGIGGDVELVSASEEVVRLRLLGNPVSERTLRALASELVIEAAPDVSVVEFEEAWDKDPSGRVALPLLSAV